MCCEHHLIFEIRSISPQLIRTTSALGWLGDCSLGSRLVDSDFLAIEFNMFLRLNLQTARDRIFVCILDDAEEVWMGTAWDGATPAHSDIDHKATVVLFLEELRRWSQPKKNRSRYGSDPDRAIDKFLGQQIDTLKIIDVHLASEIGLVKPVIQLNLVELAKVVVLDPKLLQMLGATSLWQDKRLEQSREACVRDEVPPDRHLGDLAAWIGQNTLSDALQTCNANPVVAEVKELETVIRFQGLS